MRSIKTVALVMAGVLAFSTPVCATSPTAGDTGSQTPGQSSGGTTDERAQEQVDNGTYGSVTDAIYQGNVSVPADVAKAGGSNAWESVVAEVNAYVNGVKVKILSTEKPRKIDSAVSDSANSHAAAAGMDVANKGSIDLESFIKRNGNGSSDVVYPLLINKGKFNYKEGDTFLLYNYKTGAWTEFPATGFRAGHYDLSIAKGTDMSAYFNSKGLISYLIERKK